MRLHRLIDFIKCLLGFHDWDYGSLQTLDHQGRFWFRCCMRCEKTEELGVFHREENE
jgi:hypothetical protein